MDIKNIGDRIRTVRKGKMSQTKLAEAIGISDRTTIGDWENNVITPKLENIIKVADALGCDPEWLLGCAEKPRMTTQWISEQIPLSDKAIESLRWLKDTIDNYAPMEEHTLTAGVISELVNALISEGIYDSTNKTVWTVDRLVNMIVAADRENELNKGIDHSLYLRQAFCMALGGIAYDYIDSIVKDTMLERRADSDMEAGLLLNVAKARRDYEKAVEEVKKNGKE